MFVCARSPAEFRELCGIEEAVSTCASEASAVPEREAAAIQGGESQAATIVRLQQQLDYYKRRERELDEASARHAHGHLRMSAVR